MISNIRAQGRRAPLKTLIKAVNDLLLPFVLAAGILFSILPLFTPLPGTNTRQIHIIIAICCWIVFITVKLLNKYFKNKDSEYSKYELKIARQLDLGNMVPLVILMVVVIFPFYLLFVTSLKNNMEAMSLEFTWWPKDSVDLGSAYEYVLELRNLVEYDLIRAFGNSLFYATVPCLGGLISSSIAAYAFAKMRFRGKELKYGLLIATLMLPGCVTTGATYMLYDTIGWTGTALPLIIPGLFGSASCVMFLREFFMGIPDGLLEAAEIDGAGTWKRYLYILMPLAKPALTAQFILGFISRFNDYMGPLLYLNDVDAYPVTLFIATLDGDPAIAAMRNVISAAGICAIVPMLILYIVFQKTILGGISISSGLKG